MTGEARPHRNDRSRPSWNPAQVALGCVLVAVLGRFALAVAIGVAPDEAYYLSWSRHLSAGYPDHPPAVAWLIAATARIFGESAIGLRLPALLLGGVALPILLAWLGREAGLGDRGRAWLILSSIIQPLGIAAGLIITPDVPLIIFWLLCATSTLNALRTSRIASWLLAGVALGGALLSKHSAWLLIPSIGLALLLDRRSRLKLRRLGPWLALAVGGIVASPNLYWDLSRGLPSLSFQLRHGLDGASTGGGPLGLLEYIGGQFGLLTPVVAAGAAWFLWVGARASHPQRALWAMGIVPLFVFAVASLRAHPEANWPAPTHPLLIAGTLGALETYKGGWSPSRARLVKIAALISALLTAGALVHLLSPLPFFPAEREPAARLRAWDDLPPDSWRLAERPLIAEDYELASALTYAHPARPSIALGCPSVGDCPADGVALVTTGAASSPGPPSWFRRVEHCAVVMGSHQMHRRDGAVVRTLTAYELRPVSDARCESAASSSP